MTNLTAEEVIDLFKTSRDKHRAVIKNDKVFQRLVNDLKFESEEVTFLYEVNEFIIEEKEEELKKIINNTLYRGGWKKKDPYYKACLMPISPLIYEMYLSRGINSNTFAEGFDASGMNDGFREIDRNAVDQFLDNFQERGKEYYRKLEEKTILDKFHDSNPQFSLSHIPKSWVKDYLGKMSKYAKRNGYGHLTNKHNPNAPDQREGEFYGRDRREQIEER